MAENIARSLHKQCLSLLSQGKSEMEVMDFLDLNLPQMFNPTNTCGAEVVKLLTKSLEQSFRLKARQREEEEERKSQYFFKEFVKKFVKILRREYVKEDVGDIIQIFWTAICKSDDDAKYDETQRERREQSRLKIREIAKTHFEEAYRDFCSDFRDGVL